MIEAAAQPPLLGVSEGTAFTRADPRYALAAQNVHVWDVQEHRVRISTRNGISGLWDLDSGARSASSAIQCITCARVLRSGVLTEVTLLVHGGTIYAAIGTGTPTALSGGPHMATSGRIALCHLFGTVYLVDGTNRKKVDLTAGSLSVASWDPSINGTFPAVGSALPTLAARFGARVALAGISTAPNNWFLSRVNDPLGWDVDPLDLTGSLNGDSSAGFGQLGEPIRLLAPFGEGALLFGCDSSIVLLTGDPAVVDDSKMLVLSHGVGTPAGATAWCHGPNKELYILATDGVYRLTPNDFRVEAATNLAAGRLDRFFSEIPWGSFTGSLVWDHERHGLWVFITPNAVNRSGRHLFWESRTGSWWPMRFAEPFWDGAVCATHRRTSSGVPEMLLGGRWGRVCTFQRDAIRGYDGAPVPGGTTSTRTPIGSVAPIRSELRLAPLSDEKHAEALCGGVRVRLDEWRYAHPDVVGELDGESAPRLSIDHGRTPEAASSSTSPRDNVRVTRVSDSIVNGGDASTPNVDYTRTFNGGDASTLDAAYVSGRHVFGGIAFEPVDTYQFDSPSAPATDASFLSPGEWEIVSSGPSLFERTWIIRHSLAQFLDPEYEQIGGEIDDPLNPVLLRCVRPGHGDDVVRASQASSSLSGRIDLGPLQPGQNEIRRCRLRAGGMAIRLAAVGRPMILDGVVLRLEARGPDRSKLWRA